MQTWHGSAVKATLMPTLFCRRAREARLRSTGSREARLQRSTLG